MELEDGTSNAARIRASSRGTARSRPDAVVSSLPSGTGRMTKYNVYLLFILFKGVSKCPPAQPHPERSGKLPKLLTLLSAIVLVRAGCRVFLDEPHSFNFTQRVVNGIRS